MQADRERQWIEAYFAGRTGKLLELGAFDGEKDSLTAGLIASGWEAVLVEPQPGAFSRLFERYRNNPRVQCVHAAIAAWSGLRVWYDGGGNCQAGTISTTHAQWFAANRGIKYTQHTIAAVSVADLLAFFGWSGWTFISIDVEGVNAQILRAFPLERMTDTEVVCVEEPANVRPILEPWYTAEVETAINLVGRRRHAAAI